MASLGLSVCPPTVCRLAEVGQLVERAAPPAAAVHRPRRPLAHVPQHANRLELAEGGAVVVSRRRVDQPTRSASSCVAFGHGRLEDGGVDRADVVWKETVEL